MNAYVYVRTEPGTARRVAEEIAGLDVRQVSLITGEWDMLVAIEDVEADILGKIVLDGIQQVAGVAQTRTALVADVSAMGPRPKPKPKPVPMPTRGLERGVSLLVHAQVSAGAALDVLEELAEAEAVQGVAILTGDSDLLIEVSLESWEDAGAFVLSGIQSIDGVERTSTSLIVGSKLRVAETE